LAPRMLPLVALFLVAVAAEEPVNLGDLPMQNPDLFEGDILGIDDGDISDKNAISNPGLKWPGATVPYVIDGSLSGIQHLISRAMQDYHSKTCVKFVPR
ncbi:M12 family metallopeptidase, partial [Staphylococcus aureus]|uniref:M12 family metallopeptidase n=1 Tax=Staphylococcus aureus TaxID=1280 RepID=UPI0038B3DD50